MNMYRAAFSLIEKYRSISVDEFLEKMRQRNYDVSRSWVQSFFYLLAEVYKLGRIVDGRFER